MSRDCPSSTRSSVSSVSRNGAPRATSSSVRRCPSASASARLRAEMSLRRSTSPAGVAATCSAIQRPRAWSNCSIAGGSRPASASAQAAANGAASDGGRAGASGCPARRSGARSSSRAAVALANWQHPAASSMATPSAAATHAPVVPQGGAGSMAAPVEGRASAGRRACGCIQ